MAALLGYHFKSFDTMLAQYVLDSSASNDIFNVLSDHLPDFKLQKGLISKCGILNIMSWKGNAYFKAKLIDSQQWGISIAERGWSLF